MNAGAAAGSGLSIDFRHISARIPRAIVDRVLEQTKRTSIRRRKLPAYLMVYYVIAAGLMSSVSGREVLRALLDDVRDRVWDTKALIATRAAICKARQRLGVAPLRQLYEQVVGPIAKRTTLGAWFRGLRVVAIDGSSLQLQDTPANRRRYGKAGAAKGKSSPFPLIRIVALCEIGTHVLFAARMAAWKISEVALARHVLKRLEPGMLCLADRLFCGFELWNQAVSTGAELLWRVPRSIPLPRLKTLSDGSYLSEVHPRSTAPAAERARRIPVRVIKFDIVVGRKREHYRVVTTLLDPRRAPALELAALYGRRWGIETALGEFKTHLKGAGLLLRSQKPTLVQQDFYGLLLAHFGVRSIAEEAARTKGVAPTELSFIHVLRVVIRRLPEMVSFSPLWWLPEAPLAHRG